MTTTKDIVCREVHIQRPYEMETLYDTLTHLASLAARGFIAWEARAKDGRVRYLVGTTPKSVSRVQEVFRSHSSATFVEAAPREGIGNAMKLKISKPMLPLNTDISAAMIRAALAAVTSGRTDSETVLQIVLGAPVAPSTTPRNVVDPTASWIEAILGSVPKATPEQRRMIRQKAEQYGFEATIRIGASGNHTNTRIHNIVSAIRTLESAGVRIHATREEPCNLNNAAIPWRMPLRLSAKETACFLLLPAGEEELCGVAGLHPKLLLPPKWHKEPTERSGRTFAVSDAEPKQRLSISPRDALEHTALLGPTGAGKSTTMLNLILADIKARRSVLCVDPKADLVTDILARIPEERKSDVVVIDPSDLCPTGFNPLALRQDAALTTDAILAVFQELFSQNWGIRSADILSGALLTLAQIKSANLLWLPPLLTDDAFRKRIVAQIRDPIALQPFWRHYEEMRDAERRTEIAPVLNKLRQITYRRGLRSILGQSEPKFSLEELFTKRRIVLVPLNKGLVGAESARLLGSLLVSLTWSFALSRANVAPEKRHFVSIYIDELQDYLALPTSFSDALAQARGLGVGYTVAHQYRAQLSPDVRAGIDANCRSKIVFGLNSDDAKDMAAEAPELLPLDFMTLPRYQIYTSFQSGGRNTGWISGQTLPPAPPLRMAAECKAESMRRYPRAWRGDGEGRE